MQTKPIAFAVLVFSLAGVSVGFAQTSPSQTQVFDFTNKPSQQGLQEVATILRTVGDITHLSIDSAASTITVTGTTDELAMTGWIVHQLDQPVTVPPVATASPQQYLVAGKSDDVIQVFHIANIAPVPPQVIQEALTVLRTVADVQKVFDYSALNDLVVRGPAAQVALAQYLMNSLDVAAGTATASPAYQYVAPPPRPNAAPINNVVQVFYLAHASTPQAVQEILTTLRTVLDIQKVFNFTARNAISISSSADNIAASKWLIESLDLAAAPSGQSPNVREYQVPGNGSQSANVIHVYYPTYLTTPQALQRTLTSLRTNLFIQKTFNNSKPAALVFRAAADVAARADQLIQQADKPVQTASTTTH